MSNAPTHSRFDGQSLPVDPHSSTTSAARRRTFALPALLSAIVLLASALASMPVEATPQRHAQPPSVIPAPTSIVATPGSFTLKHSTRIHVDSHSHRAIGAANALAEVLRPSTGYPIPVSRHGHPAAKSIVLKLDRSQGLGDEGYRLDVTPGGVTIRANTAAGLFYGVQTLRQLFPSKVESDRVKPGPWTVGGVHITDTPRFEWRGAMLDVSRHFFRIGEVKRYIDLLAAYKVNVLHLHLADDQGWRIEIDSWPRLATYGGSTEVGGGPGGYYTKEQYRHLVNYAQRHHIMVVPEIDMPGHTNAALASYARLNCDGVAPPLYTGTEVGFSSLCINKRITYRFINDVVRELSRMTPGPYIHIGGDEAHSTDHADYVTFVNRVERIVEAHGKDMSGWEEITGADVSSSSVAQHWWDESEAVTAADKGMKVVMSPAEKAYIDMKYDENTELGLDWAGLTSTQDSYEWDPGTWAPGVPESSVLGPEAPLWSETLEDINDIEFMAFPRMAGIAELGWSAQGRSWDEYKQRLGAHGPRWDEMSVNYYRDPAVPWQ